MSGSFTCELTLKSNQYKYTLFSSIHGATFFYTLCCWKCYYYTDWELTPIHIKHDKTFSTFLNLLSSCSSCSHTYTSLFNLSDQNKKIPLCLLHKITILLVVILKVSIFVPLFPQARLCMLTTSLNGILSVFFSSLSCALPVSCCCSCFFPCLR